MAYKSVRLLVEAIHGEMDSLRKSIMGVEASAWGGTSGGDTALEHLNELRKLFDELGVKADRPTIDDVTKQPPGEYVATMKPLVGNYHRQLMTVDKLAACLCEDLQATGVILMLIGDGKTVVRTAVDPAREEVQLAVEIILKSLDEGMKNVAEEGVNEAETLLGIDAPIDSDTLTGNLVSGELEIDERTRLLKEAERVGWDTDEGMALRERAKNYAEGEKLT